MKPEIAIKELKEDKDWLACLANNPKIAEYIQTLIEIAEEHRNCKKEIIRDFDDENEPREESF